jgi:hypothetical protein
MQIPVRAIVLTLLFLNCALLFYYFVWPSVPAPDSHKITCDIVRDGDQIVVRYLGGRDMTFVESIHIFVNGERVLDHPRPRLYESFTVPAANPEGDQVVVTAMDESIHLERVIANRTV